MTMPGNIADREEAARLLSLSTEAHRVYAEHPLNLVVSYDGEAVRCAKTNVPLVDSDETVQDDETGEVWLRSALGLPPRPEVVEDHDHDPEEDD